MKMAPQPSHSLSVQKVKDWTYCLFVWVGLVKCNWDAGRLKLKTFHIMNNSLVKITCWDREESNRACCISQRSLTSLHTMALQNHLKTVFFHICYFARSQAHGT